MVKEQDQIDMIGQLWQDLVKPVKLPVLEKSVAVSRACRDCDNLRPDLRAGEILIDTGFRLITKHALGQSASADGLLVAQNPDLPKILPIEISMIEGLAPEHG